MKAVLIDADGVLLKKQPYFSERISREYSVPYELIDPFYVHELKPCQRGEADIKEKLANYLPSWNWDKSVDDFLQYWFTTDVVLDEEVVAVVDTLRAKGWKCYIASDQEKYRASYVWNEAGLKSHLDGSFFSYAVGALKSDPEYFQQVAKTLGLQPEEILYFDDDQKNVAVAKSVGIDARFFSNLNDLRGIEN